MGGGGAVTRLRLSRVLAAAPERPAGYVEDVMSRGRVDGEWLELPDEAHAELRAKYRPVSTQPVIERPLPSSGRMVKNFAKAATGEAVARVLGKNVVSDEEIDRRLSICRACLPPDGWYRASDERCSHPDCGCWLRRKAAWRGQSCPIKKW